MDRVAHSCFLTTGLDGWPGNGGAISRLYGGWCWSEADANTTLAEAAADCGASKEGSSITGGADGATDAGDGVGTDAGFQMTARMTA